MLSLLAQWKEAFGPLRLFDYITFRAMMAGASAWLLGMLLAPGLIRWLRKRKAAQVFRDAKEVGRLAELHASKAGTPTMGGLLFLLVIPLAVLLWAPLNPLVLAVTGVLLCLGILGLVDDEAKLRGRASKGLRGRWKLLVQVAVAAGAFLLLAQHAPGLYRNLYLPFRSEPLVAALPWVLAVGFFALVLAGSSNAVNLTDGVDGLAVGAMVPALIALGVIAYCTGHFEIARYLRLEPIAGAGEIAVVAAAAVGACLAFLWHNAHPATVFMGDTGSLALGGLLGALAFATLQPLTLVIIGGVFVAEALSVIAQVTSFKTTRKRVLRMAPLHHHFELGGWAETQVVIRFWILSLLLAAAGLATLKLR